MKGKNPDRIPSAPSPKSSVVPITPGVIPSAARDPGASLRSLAPLGMTQELGMARAPGIGRGGVNVRGESPGFLDSPTKYTMFQRLRRPRPVDGLGRGPRSDEARPTAQGLAVEARDLLVAVEDALELGGCDDVLDAGERLAARAGPDLAQ